MSLNRFLPRRPAAWLAALIIAGACTAGVDRLTGPSPSDRSPSLDVGSTATGVVISQVYGGGGNNGATYTNDFIELYNRGSSAVIVDGWSVQYASSTGSTWQVTTLNGSIPAHGYYLVQESKGAGGTSALPTPDATGGIPMAGGAGKVALVSAATALSGSCPTSAAVDFVGYGAANCFEGSGPTGGLANATAAIRNGNGDQDTNDNASDFTVAAPTPRNSGSPANGGGTVTGALDHVTITGGAETLEVGASTQFSAVAQDKDGKTISGVTISWTSSDAAVTVDQTGKATGVSASTGPVTLTATAVSGSITRSATVTLTVTGPIPDAAIVISQVYGGGGNSGATLKNDFIELFNTTSNPVSLDGWSVQYGSATGTSWQVTTLAGVIQPGGYYLVQEGAGTGGTDTLPTPDATGTLNLSGTNGKVALVRSTTALGAACPLTSAPIADVVGFGSANCAEGGHATPALSNTTAAIRKGNGTVDSDDNAADFDIAATAPRNALSPRAAVAGPLDHVTITGGETTLAEGTSTDFDASGRDAANVFIGSAKISWVSSNPSVATVDKAGAVKGLVANPTPVTLTATAVANGITRTAAVSITIIPPPPVASITLTPAEWSLNVGETKQLVAAPFDANGKPTVTTFIWTSGNPDVATVDPQTGLVTGKSMGVVDITATSGNGQHAVATVTVNAVSTVKLQSGKNSFALGMQTQFFYGGTDKSGAALTSVVWSTTNPSIATVDQNGVVSGKAVGATQLVATAPDGSVGSTGIKIYLAAGSSGLRLGHNTEFGEPKDANASDDFIIRRAQYTVSYNQYRGGANWVSWNLDRTHLGTNGRCVGTCYSADTALVNAGLTAYTTADWVSNVAGSDGYDRGHMTPSADWTSSEADNNTTFFMSNFLPQTHDMNAGPWEKLENALRDSVSGGREAYIIAGGNFGPTGQGKGTLLNRGKIAIPLSTWKVAVITPAGTGINPDGTLPANSTVMAVDMPNDYGISDDGFEKYLTTVDQIQRETGYDLLALLADDVECRVEVRNCSPTARFSGATSGNEGQTLSFDGSTSSDPDAGNTLTYQWSIDGVPVGSGATLDHTFTDNGTFTVQLVATDNFGASNATTQTVNIANVAPTVAPLGTATILQGESYNATGSFTDPGADSWSATVDYGDGSGTSAASLSGKMFQLAHQYTTAGSFTVGVAVTDKDHGVGTGSTTVVVLSPLQAVSNLSAMLDNLGAAGSASTARTISGGALNKGELGSLQSKLDAAKNQLGNGNGTPAANQLNAFINELQAMVQSGRLSSGVADPFLAYAARVIASIR